jgi:hypothetical protein
MVSRYALESLVVLLLFIWLLGWLVWPIGGSLIHLLLVLVLGIVAVRLLGPRRVMP